MNKVNVIRHLAFEDLDGFAEVFRLRGLSVRYFEAGIDDLGLLGVDDDLLVVLGGPISVNQTHEFPFLRQEIELIRKRLMHDKPVLGICLGAQLIAVAAGSVVYPGTKEIGWSPLRLTEEGADSPLGLLDASAYNVLHWHGDTFHLPKGATLLASTPATPNQAFSIGRNTLGLQFHLEVTAAGLERWFIGHIGEIEATPNVSVDSLRNQTREYATTAIIAGKAVLSRWLEDICVTA